MNITITPKEIRQLAVDADVDVRTVTRTLIGLPTRDGVRNRVQAALAARGFEIPQATALTANHGDPAEGEDR